MYFRKLIIIVVLHVQHYVLQAYVAMVSIRRVSDARLLSYSTYPSLQPRNIFYGESFHEYKASKEGGNEKKLLFSTGDFVLCLPWLKVAKENEKRKLSSALSKPCFVKLDHDDAKKVSPPPPGLPTAALFSSLLHHYDNHYHHHHHHHGSYTLY